MAWAYETDQFNLPKDPLADIGPELSRWVSHRMEAAILELNERIDDETRPERLAKLQAPETLAKRVYKKIGSHFPTSQIEHYLGKDELKGQPYSFVAKYRDSIFRGAPILYWTIGPTFNVFGFSLGSDKLGHFFQQGYRYYKKISRRGMERTLSWGQRTERGIYGLFISGVYSNADLSANFAGYHFYLNLTQDLQLEDSVLPALIVLSNGHWTFSPTFDQETFLRPFISNHLNEALNPSYYRSKRRRARIQEMLDSRLCRDWQALAEVSDLSLKEVRTGLTTWHGKDYGHTPFPNFITVDEVCQLN